MEISRQILNFYHRHIFFLLTSLLAVLVCNAQNLLVNGSFEETNTCTEYRVECAPAGWISTNTSFSYYYNDPLSANDGSRYMALPAGNSNKPFFRTFLRSRLLCSLHKGNQYQVKFFIRSRHNILDDIGILFTDYDFLFEKKETAKITASLFVKDAVVQPIEGDTNWQQITLNYIATGNEIFVSIGYFSPKDLRGNTGIPLESNFLFYLDNLSMNPLDKDEMICADWQKNREDIYGQHERHQYLERLTEYYKRYPPPKERLYTPTTRGKIHTLIIPDILFAVSSASLTSMSFQALDSFCVAISKKNCDSLVVEGHTDSTGTLDLNEKLSEERAQSVAAYIASKTGIPLQKITQRSFAYFKPIASNLTVEGRQKNRRVVIYFYSRE